MTFLPIVERELRSHARRSAAHWSRWAVALVASLLSAQVLFSYSGFNDLVSGGARAYELLLGIGFAVACSAALLTADSLSAERREGTLGFLFLTDLKGHDVVLGKLASSGLTILYVMLGLVPALALPLLAGGVTLGQVFRAALSLLNFLFVSLTLGIWVSTRPQTQIRALCRAALMLIGLMWLPKLGTQLLPFRAALSLLVLSFLSLTLGVWVSTRPQPQIRALSWAALVLLGLLWLPKLGDYLLPLRMSGGFSLAMLSPEESLQAGAATVFAASPGDYWRALFVSHLVGWFFLLAAALGIGRNWRDSRTETKPETAMATSSASGEALQISAAPRERFDSVEPVRWRASRLPGQRAVLWLAPILAARNWLWMLFYFSGSRSFIQSGFLSGALLVADFGSAALIAWAASRFFLEARRTGELELLISTPVGAEQIISGQWAALWRYLRWPLAFLVCAVGLPEILSLLTRGFGFPGLGITAGAIHSLLTIVNLILGVMALSWMGMWFGLRSRGSLIAVTWTVGIVKGLPWLVQIMCYIALALGGQTMALSRTGGLPLGSILMFLAMPVLVLVANVFYIRWAKQRLQQELVAGAVFDLGRAWRESPAELLSLFRRFRHWTPP